MMTILGYDQKHYFEIMFLWELFQLDSAPPHLSHPIHAFLDKKFPCHCI